jgi:hypothetical protein
MKILSNESIIIRRILCYILLFTKLLINVILISILKVDLILNSIKLKIISIGF